MQKVTFEKTVKEILEFDFPLYFINRDANEYYMFSGPDRYITVEIHFKLQSAYINCSTVLVETQLKACLKYCNYITQYEFIQGLKIANDIIRNHITNACKMEGI